jgi:hypothetical protein
MESYVYFLWLDSWIQVKSSEPIEYIPCITPTIHVYYTTLYSPSLLSHPKCKNHIDNLIISTKNNIQGKHTQPGGPKAQIYTR